MEFNREQTLSLIGSGPVHILILAPIGQDAQVIAKLIETAGAHADVCKNLADIVEKFDDDVSSMVIAEEALTEALSLLTERLTQQPPWSDIPIIILSNSRGRIGPSQRWTLLRDLGNTTVLERPLHGQSLLIALRSTIRSRDWQYVVREQMQRMNASRSDLEQKVRDRNDSLYTAIDERRRLEQELAEAKKLESIGRLTGGVAHDFNNILQIINLSSKILAQLPASETVKRERAVLAVQRAADRGAKLTHQLLAFARRQPLVPQHFSIKHKLNEMSDYVRQALDREIDLVLDLPDALWRVKADPTQLEAAILNLAINAKEAMSEGGTLTIRAENLTLPAEGYPMVQHLTGDFVLLTVSDSGTGMNASVASQAFEPFFTTRHSDGHTGLGLSQVYGFATQSGGSVWISQPARGASVAMTLPRGEQEEADRGLAAGPDDETMTFAGLHVLCVEDNEHLAEATVIVLAQMGFEVTCVHSGEATLDQPLHRFDLVFSDVSMPGRIDGIDMAKLIARDRPNLPVLLTSGYMISPERLQHTGALFLAKPYTVAELHTSLKRALQKRLSRPSRP